MLKSIPNMVSCKICNKKFKVRPSLQNKRKFCSRECYLQSEEHKLTRKNLRPNKIGEFKGKLVIPLKITCNHCRKNFLQYKNRKKKRRYCSLGCYHDDLKNFEKAFGKKRALKIRKKMSISAINKWEDQIYRENIIKAQLKGLMKRPTSYEKKIAELCIENSLPFVYTGNGTFLINFKNPDFVNFGDKVVIEVFFSYYKIRDYGSVENYKKFCREKYEPAGWKVIFISEKEIDAHYNKKDEWKDACLNKILKVKNEN